MTYTVLALETSCDECAAAIVQDGRDVLASTVASQVEVHAPYGGVVPEVAGREHLRALVPVLDQVMRDAGLDWAALDAVAVTQGPGLGGIPAGGRERRQSHCLVARSALHPHSPH